MADVSAQDGVDVYLEVGQKRVFACALAWPGWCRSGKGEDAALDVLVAYAPRYAFVAREAGLDLPDIGRSALHIVERLQGSVGYTDFGAPGAIPASDREPWSEVEAARHLALLRAAWIVFDRVAAVTPATLRKGPRGGGRDRDQIIDHVLGADVAYARKLGVKLRQPARDDAEAIAALRGAISLALEAPSEGASAGSTVPSAGSTVGQSLEAASEGAPAGSTGWPSRYAARRIAWHVLDHAWEMEDRSRPDAMAT